MNLILGLAVVLIMLAFFFYTKGVFTEKKAGRLEWKHLKFFWMGFCFDTVGTGIMFDMTEGFSMNIHGLTGVVAIILMFIHAVWATIVLVRKKESWIQKFHYYSLCVWCVWLVPLLIGGLMAVLK